VRNEKGIDRAKNWKNQYKQIMSEEKASNPPAGLITSVPDPNDPGAGLITSVPDPSAPKPAGL
jgi:hypothetical protein